MSGIEFGKKSSPLRNQKHANVLSAQAALENDRNFVSAILDAAALVVVLDTKGQIVRFNDAYEKATGYTFDEVKDKSLWDLFILPEEGASLSIKYFLS